MLSKVFFLALIGTLFLSTNGAEEPTCNKYYTCNDDTSYTWAGMKFDCPKGKFCNANYKADTNNAKKCVPCVDSADACDGIPPIKKCNGAEFTTENDELSGKCPTGTKCNQDQANGCAPCYTEKCEPDAWKCIDDVTFETPNYKGQCVGNSVCKRNLEAPCDQPCKAKAGTTRSSLPLWRITERK